MYGQVKAVSVTKFLGDMKYLIRNCNILIKSENDPFLEEIFSSFFFCNSVFQASFSFPATTFPAQKTVHTIFVWRNMKPQNPRRAEVLWLP